MKKMSQIIFMLMQIMGIFAASRNSSFSEPGISFQYNSNLQGWDKFLQDPDNGVPQLQGYLLIMGNNATDEFNVTTEPEWTDDNLLRVCLQYWKASEDNTQREQVRWVLNYTFPNELVNFTFQASNTSAEDQYVTDWCSRPHNYKTIVEFSPKTTVVAAAGDGIKRRLESFSVVQDQVYQEFKRRFLQATATTEADLAAEAAEDASDAKLLGGGSKEKMFGTVQTGTYNGITTTMQYVNQGNRTARINFDRLFNQTDPEILDFSPEVEYRMILNWGIFKNENDTSKEHIYGAKNIKDVQNWVLLMPRAAMWLEAPVLITLLVLSVSYL